MYKTLLIALVAGVMILTGVQNVHSQGQEKLDYSLYEKVLKDFVDENGLVDYKRLEKRSEELDKVIKQIEDADINKYSDLEKKAFWINAYNAITLKVVSKGYKVGSIRLIDFGFVWKKGRKVAGEKHSLGDIEHKIVRPLGDPRIHFALNCASIGCPQLPQKPFYPETLDDQLEMETIRFVNNKGKVRLDREKDVLYYSALFDWYEDDFLEGRASILDYIKEYINESDREYLEQNEVKMKLLKYDWGLNIQKNK